MQFFFEVLIGGLLAGVMYSLVALGFVLIFKASGVFNFAQGAMVLFAALTFVSLEERGLPRWAALVATLAVMLLLALVIERVVLRPLVNQPAISLLMATIGLTFCIEGLAQGVWGSSVQGLELGIPDTPFEVKGVLISQFDLFAAVVAGVLVAVLALFFQYTRVGRALRAVADDREAAQLSGVDYRHVFGIAAAIAFATVALAGIAYGMYSQFAPTTGTDTILLFAFAAVVIGGLGSLWGTLLGGVVLGVAQQIGAQINISYEVLAGYLVFLAVLVLRPQGLTSRKAQS